VPAGTPDAPSIGAAPEPGDQGDSPGYRPGGGDEAPGAPNTGRAGEARREEAADR